MNFSTFMKYCVRWDHSLFSKNRDWFVNFYIDWWPPSQNPEMSHTSQLFLSFAFYYGNSIVIIIMAMGFLYMHTYVFMLVVGMYMYVRYNIYWLLLWYRTLILLMCVLKTHRSLYHRLDRYLKLKLIRLKF